VKVALSLLALLAVFVVAALLLDHRDEPDATAPPGVSPKLSPEAPPAPVSTTTTLPPELLEPQVVEVQQAPPMEATNPPPPPEPEPEPPVVRVPALEGDCYGLREELTARDMPEVFCSVIRCESTGRTDARNGSSTDSATAGSA
jgi:hypothetical protein